jgi:hypothetical protein
MTPQKYIYAAMGIALIATTSICFVKYRVKQDFLIFAHTTCDTQTTSCFVADCDPDTDTECDQTPYAKVWVPAKSAPKCLLENNCEDFICNSEQGCKLINCSDDQLGEGEVCSGE